MLMELKKSVLILKRPWIKEEIPELLIFPPIRTEHKIRLWVLYVGCLLTLLGHLLPQKHSVKLH